MEDRDIDRMLMTVFDQAERPPEPEPAEGDGSDRFFWWKLGLVVVVGTAIGGAIGNLVGFYAQRAIDCTWIYRCSHWWGP